MRRLRRELAVDPMAVYYHIPNKDALLTEVVKLALAEMPEIDRTTKWTEQVKTWARNYRHVVTAHPNLITQVLAEANLVAAAAESANPDLERALSIGHINDIERAAALVVDYVNGFALALVGEVPVGLHEAMDASFEYALDVIVEGRQSDGLNHSPPA